MLPPVLPFLLVFSNSEPELRQAGETVFDLRHRLPLWIQEPAGDPAFQEKITAGLAAAKVQAILEIRIHDQRQGTFPAVDLGNNGDMVGELRPDRPLTCDPGLLRDFRDVAAARFSDTLIRFELNTFDWAITPEPTPEPLPWIRIAIPRQLILDEHNQLRPKRVADLQTRFETMLAFFCKIQAWT